MHIGNLVDRILQKNKNLLLSAFFYKMFFFAIGI